jgi:hypothetical protein
LAVGLERAEVVFLMRIVGVMKVVRCSNPPQPTNRS